MNGLTRHNEDTAELALKTLRSEGPNAAITPLDELAQRRMVEAVVQQHRQMSSPVRRHTAVALAVAAILLAAVGVSLAVRYRMKPATSSAVAPPPTANASAVLSEATVPGSAFAFLLGDVRVGDRAATVRESVPIGRSIRTEDGEAALSLPTGIAVGLSRNTAISVLQERGAAFSVSQSAGMALYSVDPRQARDGFRVKTPSGMLQVVGTLFSVAISGPDDVLVKLHRGGLILLHPDGARESIVPGVVKRLHSEAPVDESWTGAMTLQMQSLSCLGGERIFSELSSAHCGEVAPEALLTGSSAKVDVGRRAPSMKALMALAHSEKTVGNWPGAASAYEKIIQGYPGSDEARTSLVSLGQIQLRHLGNSRAAMTSFSRYLRASGPLTQEAMFGKASAHRALNDTRGEIDTLLKLRREFPAGVHSASVNRRLAELEQP